jgi:crotonobetainyl-CoA:carnitine CoA-transferase CaiB-like acyl-CoA transferase
MSSLLGSAILDYTVSGNEAVPMGNSSSQAAPHNVYRCRGDDRWCAIAVFGDEEWRGFKRALGNPVWAEDKRFSTLSGRLKNSDELDRLVAAWTGEHTAAEVMSLFQEWGVSAGVVQTASDLANDPQLKARGFFIELDHPELGKTTSDATPIKLSRAPARYKRAAPTLGQDSRYVYEQLLGMTAEEVAELREKGVI